MPRSALRTRSSFVLLAAALGLAGCGGSVHLRTLGPGQPVGRLALDTSPQGPAAPARLEPLTGACLAWPGALVPAQEERMRWAARWEQHFGGRLSYVGQLKPNEFGLRDQAGVLVEVNYVAQLDKNFAVEVASGFFFGDAPKAFYYDALGAPVIINNLVMIPVTVTGQIFFFQHWYLGLGGGFYFTDHHETMGWHVATGWRVWDPINTRFNLILDARYINTENLGIELYAIGVNFHWRF